MGGAFSVATEFIMDSLCMINKENAEGSTSAID